MKVLRYYNFMRNNNNNISLLQTSFSSFLRIPFGVVVLFANMPKEEDYKAVREAFVSGHIGGSMWEIHTVTLIAPVSKASMRPRAEH